MLCVLLQKIYLVMELCAGGLSDRIKQQGPLAEKVCVWGEGVLSSSATYTVEMYVANRIKLQTEKFTPYIHLLSPPPFTKDARVIMEQLTGAVSYMHQNGEWGNHGNICSIIVG